MNVNKDKKHLIFNKNKEDEDNERKCIITERTSFFEPNVYISMIVKLQGNLNKIRNKIEDAIFMAYQLNETTMSRIVLEEDGNAYYDKMKSSGCKVIFDDRDWKSIIKESEKHPFALDQGELIRTYVIEETTKQTKRSEMNLLIMAHHLAGDGKSILIFIEDVLKCLNGDEVEYKPMYLINQEYLLDKAKLSWNIIWWTRKANQKWKKTGRVFSWEDYYKLHEVYWSNHTSEIELETYDVQILKNECKGVSLNSLLITKLLEKYSGNRVVGIPVSIREDKNGQMNAMSNQTSGTSVKCKYNPHKTFSENAYTVHKKIYQKLNNQNDKYFVLLFLSYINPTLIDSVLLSTYGCFKNKLSHKIAYIMGYLGKGGTNIGVTNLTKINIKSDYIEFKVTDILFIPPKVSYSKEIYGIATYNNKLTISHHVICSNIK